MRIIRILGSLWFAVFLISSLAGILILSTTLESLHGTPFAQQTFYEAKWFDLFLGLVWVNIFCATLTRWPFKKRHIGFVITHIGILTLLLGALGARLLGAEGQITLLEGERWGQIIQKGLDLSAASEEGAEYIFNLPDGKLRKAQRLRVPGSELQLFLEGLSDSAGDSVRITDKGEFYNPAIHFSIESQRAGVKQDHWLVAREADNAFSDQMQLGPALFRLVDPDDTAVPQRSPDPVRLVLYNNGGDPIASVNLPLSSDKPVSVADGAFKLSDVRFLPYARVIDNKLQDDAASGKWNPAVEFTITDKTGRSEDHTRFALFPDFESLHGKTTPNIFNLRVELRASEPAKPNAAEDRPSLTFTAREDSDWTWRSVKRDGTETRGLVKVGESFQTGWMDMIVTVNQAVRKAVTEHVSGPLPAGDPSAGSGVHVSYVGPDGKKKDGWVLLSRPLKIETGAGRWTLTLADRSLQMPFELMLRDFRKVDYPGTSNPSSYESDVTLFDKKNNVTIRRTIKMNEPLDYAGWRIFQSSYIQDPEYGEASVFSVAKNPGIGLTYAGAGILLLGVILLFYIRPFGSGAHVH